MSPRRFHLRDLPFAILCRLAGGLGAWLALHHAALAIGKWVLKL